MKVFFERREKLAPQIWQYYFRPERPLDFVPGQYASFHLLQPLPDPRGAARTMTITSLPAEPLLSFTAKFTAPLSPYKQALQQLAPGEELRIDDPMGDLVLPKSTDMPLVFIAGGIGIASFVSMLNLLREQREQRSIFLFYAIRSRRDQVFKETIDAYPLELKQTSISPNRLTAQEIKASTPPDALFYLSGSQPFVEGLRSELLALGTPHDHLVFDYFDGYSEL